MAYNQTIHNLKNTPFTIPIITTDDNEISIFSETSFETNPRGGMFLTEQIAAKNFRLRKSDVGYKTDFHLAGDATLIIVLKGSLKIELQNGDSRIFTSGQSFIAQDNLKENTFFNEKIHGHKAHVVGEVSLEAIHIKL